MKARCSGKIGSLVELLQGKLSSAVMEAVTDRAEGLFPKPKEIKLRCSCPDYAGLCKHLAAVMYGIGNRLDASPEILFELRGVDHRELIEEAIPASPAPGRSKRGARILESAALGAIFDIEIHDTPTAKPPTSKKAPKVKKAATATKTSKVKTATATKAAKVKKAATATKTSKVKTATATKAAKVKKAATATKTSKVKTATAAKTSKVKTTAPTQAAKTTKGAATKTKAKAKSASKKK